jgi:hypothetical protein
MILLIDNYDSLPGTCTNTSANWGQMSLSGATTS